MRYENGRPIEIEKLLISTQHKDGVDAETLIKPDLWEHVVQPILPEELYDEKKLLDDGGHNFLVNPTGKFVIGGPVGDAGLTGRKIIVDTYGGMARHGGGAFSGQGPVEGGPLGRLRRPLRGEERGRRRARGQVRGAGGVRDRRGAPGVGDGRDVRHRARRARADRRSWCDEHFDLRPGAFREYLDLHRPIYQKTAAYGHFGREDHDFTWEKTDKADTLREAAGLGERDRDRRSPSRRRPAGRTRKTSTLPFTPLKRRLPACRPVVAVAGRARAPPSRRPRCRGARTP